MKQVEQFISDRVALESDYLLPLSLWAVMTHCYEHCRFSLPYIGIRADTAASGKTRLMEVLSTLCNRPRLFVDPSDAAIRNVIHEYRPTVGVDECEEKLQTNSVLRQIFNTGYRPGGSIPRLQKNGTLMEYSTYCPKLYCMIADPVESLRSRSIMVLMRKGQPKVVDTRERYTPIGNKLAATLQHLASSHQAKIYSMYHDPSALTIKSTLQPRDLEIWRPLLSIAKVLEPTRLEELEQTAVYLSALKSHPRRRFSELAARETQALTMQYAIWLLEDILRVMGNRKQMSTEDIIRGLLSLAGKRWVAYQYTDSQNNGVSIDNTLSGQQTFATLVRLASGSSVQPKTMRIEGMLAKGYTRASVEAAVASLKA